jgi:hypothetical protein
MSEEQRRRVEEDPLSTEHGPLELIVRRPDVGGQRFIPLVQLTRRMRNQLAHGEVVSFGDFSMLWELQEGLALG